MKLTIVDDGIFTLDAVLTPNECLLLIDKAESIGFEAASVRTMSGPRMMTNIRDNDRVAIDDETLALLMWERAHSQLPVIDSETAIGVDARIRFYRYAPGQRFNRHRDGAVKNANGQSSKLSYLIYLNECDGGATLFREFQSENGNRRKVEIRIDPVAGSALLFRHERWHEGLPVNSGVKYVLRSDVFYSGKSNASS